jgi:hypothetical protein
MGIEAYGLVGVFASLVAIFSVLDMGLSTTTNREIARYSVQPGQEQETRNLVRTLEVVYWLMGAAICILLVMLAPLIATRWIKTTQMSSSTVQASIIVMGFVLVSRWPLSLYAGGLMGYHNTKRRQCRRDLARPGAVPTVVSPTVQAIFVGCCHRLETAITPSLAHLPAGRKSRFRRPAFLLGALLG